MFVNNTGVKGLIDSGSSVTIVNRRLLQPQDLLPGRAVRIKGFDGTAKLFEHWARVTLRLSDSEIETEALVIDGVDYDLLLSRPDMRRMHLNVYWDDTVGVDNAPSRSTVTPPHDASPPDVRSKEDVAKHYPELLSVSGYPSATSAIQVPFELADTTPVRRRPYRMSREKKEWLKGELQQMLNAGIIRPSTSTFASPLTIAPKSDGSFRLCTDYRAVNKQTDIFPFPMPHVDDIINDTGGCAVFSCLDLCKGFWQVPLAEETKQYTAFVTPFDLYEYNRLPFGWKNSSAWFQKLMTSVLEPYIGKFVHVYIDDILIYSRSPEEHSIHVTQVLQSLKRANLQVNIKKSLFFQPNVVFLGRVFDGQTKTTKQESVQKIRNLRKPCDVHSLRVFLGLAGHFRAFIKDYAKRTKCLTELLQKGTSFTWTTECDAAYNDVVEMISSNPVLSIPDFRLPFELCTDASQYGTGAVLYQRDTSKSGPQQLTVIGYHSYTFNGAEQNYCTTEKELLAVVHAVRYFRTFLEGRRFTLFTDHQPVAHIMTSADLKGRLARWVTELQHFDIDVHYKPGKNLLDADAMSRLGLDAHAITSIEDGRLWEGTEPLKPKGHRFEVPETLRLKILNLYHDSPHSGGHDGIWRTYRKISKRFTWPRLKHDVTSYVRSCDRCQKYKVKYNQRTDVMTLPEHSNSPFEIVHLDFAELKKKAEGVKKTQAFLLAVDECTRMVATRPGGEDSNSVIALLERGIFADTKIIVCDNGPAFTSKRLKLWCQQRGICIKLTAPYHPAANGMAERAIREIKQFIHLYPDFPGGWRACLAAATQHQNRSHNKGIGCSPHYALHGAPPTLSADTELGIAEKLQLAEKRHTAAQESNYRRSVKKYFDRRHSARLPDIQVGDLVTVRTGLPGSAQALLGPVQVLQTAHKQGILKTIGYNHPSGQYRLATIGNVFKYHPRRDGLSSPGPV